MLNYQFINFSEVHIFTVNISSSKSKSLEALAFKPGSYYNLNSNNQKDSKKLVQKFSRSNLQHYYKKERKQVRT